MCAALPLEARRESFSQPIYICRLKAINVLLHRLTCAVKRYDTSSSPEDDEGTVDDGERSGCNNGRRARVAAEA